MGDRDTASQSANTLLQTKTEGQGINPCPSIFASTSRDEEALHLVPLRDMVYRLPV
ncbi:hypothetical protein AciX8_4034 [Granulicella mallensis MP5ACTX8]|uniref:Uncharacterized protein n=1 Tax=Granulicella mallensis (strain ATCC BAA-1857 / DSM 23137 / MP5ACTX8) TaxID=682795 RepID=G8NPY2_GRAMM|nr:hypothetical protein AciX8_4034 [Granulicella mallensis MP5ACTX8]